MGGSKQTQKSNSTTTSSQNQTTTTPGTSYSSALLPNGNALASQVMGSDAFTGPRVAAAPDLGQGNYAAQWGAMPDTFVPQATAGPQAQQATQTHVDLNAQEGIDAGMAAANLNNANIPGLVQQGYDRWSSILGGQQNPQLDALLARLQQEHAEGAAQNTNATADAFGAAGAYGGSNMGRELTWMAEQQQQELDGAVASLLYQDYNNNQQMLMQAPEALAGFAGLAGVPAEQYARYGGMRQENLADAAATGDYNTQVGYDNTWNTQRLADENAERTAADDLARWEAAYQTDASRVADLQGRTAAQTAGTQAGYDNDYLAWLSEQENLNNQIANMGNLIGYGGMVPGSTTKGSGTSTTNSTTTTQQQAAPWQIAAGLGGAALQAFSPGGLFSGGLSALGGGMKTAAQAPLAPLPAWSPTQLMTMR